MHWGGVSIPGSIVAAIPTVVGRACPQAGGAGLRTARPTSATPVCHDENGCDVAIPLIPGPARNTLGLMNPTSLLLIGALLLTTDARADVAAVNSTYKVRDFGAQGDGTALDTAG